MYTGVRQYYYVIQNDVNVFMKEQFSPERRFCGKRIQLQFSFIFRSLLYMQNCTKNAKSDFDDCCTRGFSNELTV